MFLVCFTCELITVFRIYVALLLMGIALLGCVLCDPSTYHPHKSPGPWDSAAQTADRELQSAGPLIFLTSVNTPFRCRPRGPNTILHFFLSLSNVLSVIQDCNPKRPLQAPVHCIFKISLGCDLLFISKCLGGKFQLCDVSCELCMLYMYI